MRFEDRLRKLEKNSHTQSVTAELADGNQLRFRRRDVLAMTCAAMRRRSAQIEGEPIPASPFDEKLVKLVRAGVVNCSEPLVGVICDVLKGEQPE